jgi:hypothetical protein
VHETVPKAVIVAEFTVYHFLSALWRTMSILAYLKFLSPEMTALMAQKVTKNSPEMRAFFPSGWTQLGAPWLRTLAKHQAESFSGALSYATNGDYINDYIQ